MENQMVRGGVCGACSQLSYEERIKMAGYIPIVGTGVGLVRIPYGFVEASFVSLAYCCLDTDLTKYHFTNGLKHMCRGCIELVPIFGFCVLLCYDVNCASNESFENNHADNELELVTITTNLPVEVVTHEGDETHYQQ